MNLYGRLAMAYWRTWLPHRCSYLDNPDEFFTRLGDQVQEQIIELAFELAGPDPWGETLSLRRRRRDQALMEAQKLVLRRMVLLEPEPVLDPDHEIA